MNIQFSIVLVDVVSLSFISVCFSTALLAALGLLFCSPMTVRDVSPTAPIADILVDAVYILIFRLLPNFYNKTVTRWCLY